MRSILMATLISLICSGCGDTDVGHSETGAAKQDHERHMASTSPRVLRAPDGLVEIEATYVTDTEADVRLRFRIPAVALSVRVYGTDGLLVLTDEYPVRSQFYEAGDEVNLQIRHGASNDVARNIVVRIEGVFAGRRRSVVRTISVGPRLQKVDSEALDEVEIDGRRVRIHRLPAREKK